MSKINQGTQGYSRTTNGSAGDILARMNYEDIHRIRLSKEEYGKLELEAQKLANFYRATDAGALGVRLGIELMLRAVREGFTHG